jgi:DNA-binding response OmpR family regulator
MNILIVEDEKKLAEEIANYLEGFNYKCTVVGLYSEALQRFNEQEFVVTILDLNLPDGHGLQLIQYLKQKRITSGIIVISANNELDMRLNALELGADDFFVKPFHLSELTAHVKAFIRRHRYHGNNLVIHNEIKIDVPKLEVSVNDKPIVLTGKEYDLLLYFISNVGKVIAKDAIGYSVWNMHSDMDVTNEIIYTHVKNLRKKLLSAGANDYIKSVYGVGYKFDK